MPSRRQSPCSQVIYGGTAEIAEGGASGHSTVRNISNDGRGAAIGNTARFAENWLQPTIARKGRFLLERIISLRDNFISVALYPKQSYELPGSDLAERLRKSELKKRQLQRRIKELIEG